MRIGFTGNFESPITRIWVDEMASRGIEAIALSAEKPSWEIEWQPVVPRRPRVRGIGLGRRDLANQILEAVRVQRIDLLHSHEARRHAFWVRSSHFRPRVISCWGSDVMRLHETPVGHRLGVRMALATADAVFAGSQTLVDAAVAAGARRERSSKIGWGVDLDVYSRNEASRSKIRTEWGFAEKTVIVSTRRHWPLYRIDLILRAFRHAFESDSSLALVVVGDGPETPRLRQLAQQLELQDAVRFTGSVPELGWPTMVDVLSGGDIYCSVPETDGGPLSVLEAMACGLPVVASDIPVMREWIQPGETGAIAAAAETDVAAAFTAVATNVERMGRSAREFVTSSHSRADEMDRAFDVYERLVRGRERA